LCWGWGDFLGGVFWGDLGWFYGVYMGIVGVVWKVFWQCSEGAFREIVGAWGAGVSLPCRGASYFSLRGHERAGARTNSAAGPKGVGQDARSKEK
jgi:hypothetical protein